MKTNDSLPQPVRLQKKLIDNLLRSRESSSQGKFPISDTNVDMDLLFFNVAVNAYRDGNKETAERYLQKCLEVFPARRAALFQKCVELATRKLNIHAHKIDFFLLRFVVSNANPDDKIYLIAQDALWLKTGISILV